MQKVTVVMDDTPQLHDAFEELIRQHNGQIVECDISKDGSHIVMQVVVRLENRISFEVSAQFLKEHDGITRIAV